jgi:hypothetical protein
LTWPFGGNRVFYPLELLMEDECYQPPTGGVAVERTCIMFSNALFEAAARCADVI